MVRISGARAINLELLTTAIFSPWKPLDIDPQAIALNERGFAYLYVLIKKMMIELWILFLQF